jgi:hypothetical protein
VCLGPFTVELATVPFGAVMVALSLIRGRTEGVCDDVDVDVDIAPAGWWAGGALKVVIYLRWRGNYVEWSVDAPRSQEFTIGLEAALDRAERM